MFFWILLEWVVRLAVVPPSLKLRMAGEFVIQVPFVPYTFSIPESILVNQWYNDTIVKSSLMKKYKTLFEGKHIAVIGYGVEGASVVRFLVSQSVGEISIFDEKKSTTDISYPSSSTTHIDVRIGPILDLSRYDMIIVSPGVRIDLPVIQKAEKQGVVVTTGTNLFMDMCPCKVIGVTGTKGKGTTSSLITEMLKADGVDAYLGGNIGIAPLDFLEKLTSHSCVVLELSSFQLSSLKKSPDIAVIVMVTSEHLDYHKDTHEYVEAKAGIVLNQKPHGEVVVNVDYPNSVHIAELSKKHYWQVSAKHTVKRGAYVSRGNVMWSDGKETETIIPVNKIFIPGKHNWENVCAAVATAKILGIANSSIVRIIELFKGLPHRIEFVREVGEVRYYDDSFSTVPETAIAALEAFDEPKVLILGGSSKNSDFTELGNVIASCKSLRAIIGIGKEWIRIKEAVGYQLSAISVVENCKNMKEIIEVAHDVAKPGDVVLLTPACASFDMFKNYKDRGEQFKKIVLALS
jgi:UDP-N-acetylmuramoylalanine--D-glutamate ligase